MFFVRGCCAALSFSLRTWRKFSLEGLATAIEIASAICHPTLICQAGKTCTKPFCSKRKGAQWPAFRPKPCGRLRATERETERSRRRVAIRPAWRAPVAILRRLSVRFGDMRRSAADWVAGNLTSSDRHYRAAVLATSGDGRQPHKHEQAPCVYRCCALWLKYYATGN